MKLYKLWLDLVECDGDSEVVICDAEIGDYSNSESVANAGFDLVLEILNDNNIYSRMEKLKKKGNTNA